MLMLNAGQNKAVNAVADSVLRSRAGLASQTRGSSFLFLGPTGVGKTELAKALAELLFDDEKNMVSLARRSGDIITPDTLIVTALLP